MSKRFVNEALIIAVAALLKNNEAAISEVKNEIERIDKIADIEDEEEDYQEFDDNYHAQEVARNLKILLNMDVSSYDEEEDDNNSLKRKRK